MKKSLIVLNIAILLSLSQLCQARSELQQKVSAAKAGETVILSEGTISGPLTVPAGVSVQGAGVDKTIIDATAATNGLIIEDGSGAIVSDLTVRGAKGAGVFLRSEESIAVSRVRVTGCSTGLMLSKVKRGRIENCIVDRGNFGIVINGGSDCTVVNCTLVDCVEMGISMAGTTNAMVLNNCIVGSAICLNIDKPSNVKSDHNLYFRFVRCPDDRPGAQEGAQWLVVCDGRGRQGRLGRSLGSDARGLQGRCRWRLHAGDCLAVGP